jgi:DNA-binding Lrp family transcriptional regulator
VIKRLTARSRSRELIVQLALYPGELEAVIEANGEARMVSATYLLRIVTSDLAAYQRLQDDRLAVLPGVQRMTSTLVMKRIVHDRPLPA